MMETKFTPGPWELWGTDESGDFDVLHSDDTGMPSITRVYTSGLADEKDGYDINPSIGKANAHLIAAAPAMYSELDEVRELLEWFLTDQKLIEYIDDQGWSIDAYLQDVTEMQAKARGE